MKTNLDNAIKKAMCVGPVHGMVDRTVVETKTYIAQRVGVALSENSTNTEVYQAITKLWREILTGGGQ